MATSRRLMDLNCMVCMNDLEDPRLLPCFHTFCRGCLYETIATDYNNGSFGCPLCQEIVSVPRNGAKGLPINSFLERRSRTKEISCDVCEEDRQAIISCRECDQNFCRKCSDIHERMQGTTSHSVRYIETGTPRLPKCTKHLDEKLEYCCDTCNMVVCSVCIKFGHKSHPIQDVSSVADSLRDDIKPLLNSIIMDTNPRSYKFQVARQTKKIDRDEEGVMEVLNQQTYKFKAVVDEVRSDFVRQLLEAVSDSKSELSDNKGIVSKNCAAVDYLHKFAKYFMKNANDCEIIKYGPALKERLDKAEYGKAALMNFQKFEFIPKEIVMSDVKRLFGFFTPSKYDFAFSGGVNIVHSFRCSLEDCTITSLTFMPDNTLWVCMGNNGVLERYNYNGIKKAEIRLEHRIDCVASDSLGILYVTCNAEKKIISFNNKNTYKREHIIDTELCARGIAIDKHDCVIVGMTERDVFFDSTYPQMGRVVVISPDKSTRILHGDELVQYPARVAVNNTGAIAISDWIGLCVIIFRNNRKVGYFNGKRDGFLHFSPRGICSSKDGRFIIVDSASNCLHWITETGILERTIESRNHIGEPYSVTVDAHGGMWIGTKDGRIVQLCI